jgi:phosphotransferase system  glucose/maltose/N-acetylglucosamine-specific IIC component
MENILDKPEERSTLTDKNLFKRIWTSPRQVFRYIHNREYEKYYIVLLVLSGISRAFDRASMKNMGDTMSLLEIIGYCIVVGGLLGWIFYYLYAALLSWTGKWLNGKGDTTSILRILSYAMIPSNIALLLLIPQIGIYGVEIFKEDGDLTSAGPIANILVFGSMI